MYLRNFINNLDKKYKNISFSGIAFDSEKNKKKYFFAIEIDLMEIILLQMQLKRRK